MTETRTPYVASTRRRQRGGGAQALPDAEESGFPGCETVSMDADQFARCRRHVEYWDARRGLAWMVREAGFEHDRPPVRLSVLVHRIAQLRGSAIECHGALSLHDRDADGDVRVMEPDHAIYLDGKWARTLSSPALVRDGEAPDVVLEVDHTTDARRRKLGVYEEWAIPEVWIEVPDAPSRSRPRSRRSGLAIHALNADAKRYEDAAASRVLPGWTREEIHLALNEAAISEATWAAIERVGRALGQREGTEPAHDPIQRRELAAGREEGRKEGKAQATADERAALVRAILAQRGIAFPPAFLASADARRRLLRHDAERIVAFAYKCRSADGFLSRLASSR